MNRRSFSLVFLVMVAVLTLPGIRFLQAQFPRIQVQRPHYRVRVVNDLGQWVRVGMIGYDRQANMRVELGSGRSWTGDLWAGERMVVAWDRQRNLIFASEVEIDRSGTLRLEPMWHSQEGVPLRERGPAAGSGPLPRMQMEP